MKHEWRKTEKHYYLPPSKPEQRIIPAFSFFSIQGKGNPNDKFFTEYIGVLYSLSYAVKMSPKSGMAPDRYEDFTVYPLEGVWDISEEAKQRRSTTLDKDSLVFTLMIRQPEFVTETFAQEILRRTKEKKPHPLLNQVHFETCEEGLCVQMLHQGSFDSEPKSFGVMEDFCIQQRLRRVSMQHREIYLSDTRKVAPEKWKTVLRWKVISDA